MFNDVADLVPIPAISLAATTLLGIMNRVQQAQGYKESCMRLAQRAANVLKDLCLRMKDKWDRAPAPMLDNVKRFTEALLAMQALLDEIVGSSLTQRILSPSSIQDKLDWCQTEFDQAALTFQNSSLMEIHFLVDGLPEKISDDFQRIMKVSAATAETKDEFGYRKYHQSEVKLLKKKRVGGGWFSGLSEAVVKGEKGDKENVLIKTYSGPEAAKQWHSEIELLRNLFHPNLPQMLGYSNEKTANPFIVMTNGQIHDYQSYMVKAARSESVEGGTYKMFKAFMDMTSALCHLKEQLSIDDGQATVVAWNATYVVNMDGENTSVVVGLPPKGNVDLGAVSTTEDARSDLFEHMLNILTGINDNIPCERNFHRMVDASVPVLHDMWTQSSSTEAMEEFSDMDLEDFLEKIQAVRKDRHKFSYYARAPPLTCRLGDFGYYPNDPKAHFQLLGNLLEYRGGMLPSSTVTSHKELYASTPAQVSEGEYAQGQMQLMNMTLADGVVSWRIEFPPPTVATSSRMLLRRRDYFDSSLVPGLIKIVSSVLCGDLWMMDCGPNPDPPPPYSGGSLDPPQILQYDFSVPAIDISAIPKQPKVTPAPEMRHADLFTASLRGGAKGYPWFGCVQPDPSDPDWDGDLSVISTNDDEKDQVVELEKFDDSGSDDSDADEEFFEVAEDFDDE
ncbi:hypothetical protein FA95DRAFT_752458 [Auriscalpium vulgare]|uniref:Uncharacterized protein n=1 Tax=Auriscalpium vulgare TaxID=40419 RepID=A0ACB8SBE1_9AGAM|nr:hypothetical protein FA95DRAFT_752458 [Auriscalpium vulgare]